MLHHANNGFAQNYNCCKVTGPARVGFFLLKFETSNLRCLTVKLYNLKYI